MRKIPLWLFSFLVSSGSPSVPALAAIPETPPTVVGQSEAASKPETRSSWLNSVGLSYFTYFDGPGLAPGMSEFTPNVLGKPGDDGLRLNNLISIKYKLSSLLAVDLQLRVQWVLNNANQVESFHPFRWQSPRIGISGKLLSGQDWALTGAVNTDFPYFFPQPLGGGVVATQRTTVFNPGLFAKFSYTPKQSAWSLFSLVRPRFFIYADRNVAEPQLSRAGFSPVLKNEFLFDLAPSANYALSSSYQLRFGTELSYSKLIRSSWSPFHASLNNTDISSDSWRLAPVPIQIGIAHEFPDFKGALNVSAFVQAFPIAAQRVRRDGSQAEFWETASIGMWISGTVI